MNYLRSLKNLILEIIILLLIISNSVSSQTELDTSKTVQSTDSVFVMQKSPTGAILRSAVIPGWGQFYNESYWKIPVVWGFLGYFGYIWVKNHELYWDNKKLFIESLATDPTGYMGSNYKSNRDFYRNQRDEFAVYFAITYVLTIVDAYVDSHLFDFNILYNSTYNHAELKLKINLGGF